MDVSSEMIHALLPLFLTGVLGASLAVVGVIDGIAEATAAIAKVFSGYVSDRIGKRRPLILLGYGLGAVSKPLFALAGAPGPVLGARFLDRIGKGLRGAPRDALVADVTPPDLRGRAYGLRQSLDTVGAFLGPLLAVGLMALWANDMRAVFWVAAIPAAISVGIALIASLTKLSITRLRPVPVLEIDFELVAFLSGDCAVSELVVEHARPRRRRRAAWRQSWRRCGSPRAGGGAWAS
jgi:MFS family permease